MLHEIEKTECLYEICYRRAGVGFLFYKPPTTEAYLDVPLPKDWKKYLVVDGYYKTFEEAVRGEWKKLKEKNGKESIEVR